ncbi:MAG: threonine--tRNA ligase [Candidatus Paceibacterota bacterium]
MNKENIIRHSLAHILAIAVKEKYKEVKLGMGPAIENGFYYDFDNLEIEEKDLKEIEKRMKHIIKQNVSFEEREVSKKEAKEIFKNEPYKLELLDEIDKVCIYKTGDFRDLCNGPHIKNTKEIDPNTFKLERIAGAYFKGDEKNKMLTRIYGIAFESKEKLEKYLEFQKEAKKRDHRVLARKLDLFHTDEDVGAGLILWHPKGALLYRLIEDFWIKKHLENGYELIRTPHIGNRKLWEKSGHFGFYSGSMFPPLEASQSLEDAEKKEDIKESEQFLLKPMNCPFHIAIYNSNLHSYKEFPIRWAETGTVYRFEKKGELSGLTRVRGFTQDDAHIFCRKDQVEDELKKVIDFILYIYEFFGFDMSSVNVYLSLRDPLNKEKYVGDDEGWDFSEAVLRKVAKEKGLHFKEELGEAAFYGPKLDFKIKDALQREWQCSTLQFDFNLPKRFEMTFVNDKGEKEKPYMIHRALFGSFERFIGLLIEHYEGSFPFWLAPIQISIIPVSVSHRDYAYKVREQLKEFRVKVMDEDETVSKKIRESAVQKIPYIITVGDNEIENNTISVRKRGNQNLGELTINNFIKKL